MDISNYLFSPTDAFGPLTWVFFIVQIVAVLAGVYLAFIRQDRFAVRASALRRLGYALIALGAVGALVTGLRLALVQPFTPRYWMYIVAAFEAGLAFFALYYSRAIYPAQVAAHESQVKRTQRAVASSRVQSTPAPERPSSSLVYPDSRPIPSARRDARRERKRRRK